MIFFIVIVLFLATLYLYNNIKRKRRLPQDLKEIPIEKGLPIIGVVNKIEKPLCNYLYNLSLKRGPIYRIRMGMRDIVVLNSFEYIKAALVDNADALSGRWKALQYIYITENAGIILIDGNVWSSQRAFVLRNMKDFGMGRSRSTEVVQDECICMLEDLEKLKGRRIDFPQFIPIYLVNVISRFIMSKRFTHDDPFFLIVEKYMKLFANKDDTFVNFSLMFPIIENNEWLMQFFLWVMSRLTMFDEYYGLFQKEVENHLKNLDYNSEGDDLMDRFLIKQHQLKEKQGDVETFTDFQLVSSISDLFTAGYDTTSTTLVWAFMLMGRYPEVQNKVYEEIIDKIGNERLPTMSDKVTLNYTQAVMDEIFRLSSIVPLSIMHRTLNDVSVKGYFIPKNTEVIPNILACHLDPNVWEKPMEFYPEHFLVTESNGAVRYRSREEVIPFSMGKRQCLGESLARMEYFIFFTSVLQRFQVTLANESDKEMTFDPLQANEGVIRTINVKDFIFNRRC